MYSSLRHYVHDGLELRECRWTEAPAQSCRSGRTARQRGHERP